jgi:hypothetical protein
MNFGFLTSVGVYEVWTEKPAGYLEGYIYILGGGELGKDPGPRSYPVIIKFIDPPHPRTWKIQISHNDN